MEVSSRRAAALDRPSRSASELVLLVLVALILIVVLLTLGVRRSTGSARRYSARLRF